MTKANANQRDLSKTILLGIQHVFAMFGATVLVPILTGLNISIALFAAGVGTLIFHFITKRKVPVFLGSSFAFIGGIATVVNDPNYGAGYAGGGIIVAGVLYVLFSLTVRAFGVERIRRIFPPVVTGPMIMIIGLTLAPAVIGGNIVTAAVGLLWQRWTVAAFVIAAMVITAIFVKGFFKLVPILIGIAVGYIVALIFGMVDISAVSAAPWIGVPDFAWPKFALQPILLIAPIAIVTFMEHIGDMTTVSSVVGKDFISDPGLDRTLLGDGVATIFAGLIGGPANTTYSENTGVLAVTRNFDPFNIRVAAVIAIIMSVVGKFGALLATIPAPVMGGVSFLLFGMITVTGMRTIKEGDIDFNRSRNLIIISLMLITGLTVSIPISETVTISGLALAAIVGLALNLILPQDA